MAEQGKPENSAKRKMSEMISEMAGQFIDFGKTTEDRQNRLNAACSAWNMSCGSPEIFRTQLAQYVEGYRRFNPATSSSDLDDIRSDMESLIERKLKMFPEDQRQIVNAKIVVVGDEYRIEVLISQAVVMIVVGCRILLLQGGQQPMSQPRKMSEIMKEMSERLLRNPESVPSPEAAHVALMFANIAWNEAVGLGHLREGYRSAWKVIEAENPQMWSEFNLNDIEEMIDELVQYKNQHFPDDQRRILTCGIPDGKVRVEWLPAAAPGIDSRWEMQLYGLVRSGERQRAMRFLQDTRGVSRAEAKKRVAGIAAHLGLAGK